MASSHSGKNNEPYSGSLAFEEPVRVYHTKRNVLIVILVVALVAVGGFFGVRARHNVQDSAPKGSKSNPVKLGVVGAADREWALYVKKAQEAGIYIKLVDFQDYTSANPALDAGDIDISEFQHILLLANYNLKNHKELQPIGGTGIYQLGLYSGKPNVTSVADIPAGTSIPVPNDETNCARAIDVLQEAGLIKLKRPWNVFSTPADIDTANSKVKVTPVQSQAVPNALKDPTVYAGVINNAFVEDAGLKPNQAIFRQDIRSKALRPYINVFVTRKSDINNPTYLKMVKIFHSKEVLDAIVEKSLGTVVLADQYSGEQLRSIMRNVMEEGRHVSSAQ